MLIKSIIKAVSILFLFNIVQSGYSCTAIKLKAEDGSIIYGRTNEFAVDIQSKVLVVPRGINYVGTTMSGKNGLRWKTKYALTGLSIYDDPLVADGINEKGLSVSMLYFPGFTQYTSQTDANASHALAAWEVATYLLSNYSSIDEVKSGIKEVTVVPVAFKRWGFTPPLHYLINDNKGNSIVIEYIKGKRRIYNNPLGVLTNSPSFNWHMLNLGNYMMLTPDNREPLKFGGITLTGLGQGSGLLGMPGDFTPPSRFVRAVIFSQASAPVKTGIDAIVQVFHILNQFDIPKGVVRDKIAAGSDKNPYEYTQWTVAGDLTKQRFYFHTEDDRRVRMIDLNKISSGVKNVVFIPLHDRKNPFKDLTDLAK